MLPAQPLFNGAMAQTWITLQICLKIVITVLLVVITDSLVVLKLADSVLKLADSVKESKQLHLASQVFKNNATDLIIVNIIKTMNNNQWFDIIIWYMFT